MQLSPIQFKILILVIGAVIGLALSFMIYSVTHSYVSFAFVPISMLMVYFQQFHPIGRKD